MLKHSERIGRGRVRGASGATLVEVLVAVVILGLLVATLPSFWVLAQQTELRRSEIAIGQSLTRNQLEYIKTQAYMWGNETYPITNDCTGTGQGYRMVTCPSNYSVRMKAEAIDAVSGEVLPTKGNETHHYVEDQGIQRITVRVFGWRYAPGDWEGQREPPPKSIFETSGYKVAPGHSLEIQRYEVED